MSDRATPGTDQQLGQARALVNQRQLDAAAKLFEQIAFAQPKNVEALTFLADHALHQGDVAQAVMTLERILAVTQELVPIHQRLAHALERLYAQDDSEEQLRAIVQELPGAYSSELFLAQLLEQRGDHFTAVTTALRSIKNAQLHGFWFSDRSTGPWLQKRVNHALAFVHAGRLDWFHRVLDPLMARYGRDELQRVSDCISMYCGEKPLRIADPRQKPSFLYFPDLPSQPTFRRDQLPFAEWLEQQADAMRGELFEILSTDEGVEPFHNYENPEQAAHLFRGLPWQAYFFFRNGESFDDHHLKCPKTSSVLARLPLVHIKDHAPECCFSILRPGSHILPHRGVTNTRSVLHLPLIVPEHCVLKLTGIDEYRWQQDHCFAFDDTYEHEAWNRSEQTRVILLTDIWNPNLRTAECLALTELVEQIGVFNRATEVPPKGPASAPS